MHFKMLSAICFNLNQSKILSPGQNALKESLSIETYMLLESLLHGSQQNDETKKCSFWWRNITTPYSLSFSYTEEVDF